ncbi:molybdopterin-guanine dinucleotide biosynthesis protein MobC [Photorhabdus sp. CRCIA-P01]|uniref:molybdopterin-guanine dinucleotide biosynthesis protein MobC n=1 Tax=Photorhabdus sp. CRCIA-P01 TaxID=2019570 RepID=UPI000E59C98D|nr:molybdopterin-guanine dinucleotide biosynthesis protein MobC [Photorhabdus sp. CRCIA-P01]
MASQKFFSIEEIKLAKEQLQEMPDLNKQRMTLDQALDDMKDDLLVLFNKKGYKIYEIKSALDSVGITVSTRKINEIISNNKKQKINKKNKIYNTKNTES